MCGFMALRFQCNGTSASLGVVNTGALIFPIKEEVDLTLSPFKRPSLRLNMRGYYQLKIIAILRGIFNIRESFKQRTLIGVIV